MNWFKAELVFSAEDAEAAVEIVGVLQKSFPVGTSIDSTVVTKVPNAGFEETDEPTKGFVCDACHQWFPGSRFPVPRHECLVGLRA